MPLKVIVVGAGIGGLCAAISLRRAGHEVEAFEKSAFATEVGAATVLTPNGARVLSRLGFSLSRARAVKVEMFETVHSDTMMPITSVDLSQSEAKYGASTWTLHRVDLHTELLRLATSPTEPGKPVQLRLGAEIVGAATEGIVEMLDGSKHQADLVVGADGLHSVVKSAVLGKKAAPPVPSGLSAFRFLIDTETLQVDPKLSEFLSRKGSGSTLLADTKDLTGERHMVWYGCRGGEVQNFAGIHPTRKEDSADQKEGAVKASMIKEFGHFYPEVVQIIAKSSAVKCWPLFFHEPLLTWFNGRVVLIGDAAHPMLPFSGQGANQAIEDGGALGYLLEGVEDGAGIRDRLLLFERARKGRASRVQTLSKVRVGKEKEVEEELRSYAEPPGSAVPSTMQERTDHDYGFDIFAKCEEVLQSQQGKPK